MILFNVENDFKLANEEVVSEWISKVLQIEGFQVGDINYVFCDDAYLHKLNVQFLNHDTLTDIISFDDTVGKVVSGDIFISTERVTENAKTYGVSFEEELHRVMIHGALHFMGYKDKSESEVEEMRNAENKALSLINN